MAFDVRKLKADARKDYRKAWVESARLVPEKTKASYSVGKGKPHPVQDLLQKVRKVFLGMGFDEVENPLMVSEEDVYKQYGPEAPIILDRVYYLAGLPRPDIGVSNEILRGVERIVPEKTRIEHTNEEAGDVVKKTQTFFDELFKIFREYRKGDIEGDNLIEEMVNRLKIPTDQAAAIINLVPEFKNMTPIPSKQTLRSHMTGAWFPTIAALIGKRGTPMLLFSVGLRFRREQKVDARHLRAHYGASMVVVDDQMSVEAGMKLTEEILKRLDFKSIRFVKKKATSNYYAPDTEYEVYSGDIEVADIGMYSPIALANYDIPVNVFNLGFGLERFIMAKEKVGDVRELLYPQFYGVKDFSDEELVREIRIEKSPKSGDGVRLAAAIKEAAVAYASEKSPCSFAAFGGSLWGRKIKVDVLEKEDNTLLLGPAALNDVIVFESGIYGIPKDASKLKANVADIRAKGLKADFGFIDAIAAYFAHEIERAVASGESSGFIQMKMAKSPADVNISVSEAARRFVESKNKPISIKGPVFTAVSFQLL